MLGSLHVKISRLNQPEQNILHILAHITGLCKGCGIGDGEGHIQHSGEGLGHERLPRACGTEKQHIALLQLHITAGGTVQDAFIVVIHRNGENPLRLILPNDILIQLLFDLGGLWKLLEAEIHGPGRLIGRPGIGLSHNVHAGSHALITDIGAVACNQTTGKVLRPAAEGTSDRLCIVSCHKVSPKIQGEQLSPLKMINL